MREESPISAFLGLSSASLRDTFFETLTDAAEIDGGSCLEAASRTAELRQIMLHWPISNVQMTIRQFFGQFYGDASDPC
jgi:hypothetical protein